MNKIIYTLSFVLISLFAVNAQDKTTTKTDTIKVWGNCEMCQTTIQKAAKKVKGVVRANWDVDKKILVVTYKPSETTNLDIQKAVAASGYDTEDVKGDDKAYSKLHGCCQYDRKP